MTNPPGKNGKPKPAALIAAFGGMGSHFILHKLQGHPSLTALGEISFRSQGGTTKGNFKEYMSTNKFFMDLFEEQLNPKKDIEHILEIGNRGHLILNKPPLKMVNYHRVFHPWIPVLYIYRNPISLYYTWVKKWKESGDKRYKKSASDERVFEWFRSNYMSSLIEFAQCYDPKRDMVISFEHFFNDIDSELERIYRRLRVPFVKDVNLKTFNGCATCGTEKVIKKKVHVRGERYEDVLYCHRHGPSYGPGEYNYIRKEDPSFLNKWKSKDDVVNISLKFSKIFGFNLMSYYADEKYKTDIDRSEFDVLINEFLEGLKIET